HNFGIGSGDGRIRYGEGLCVGHRHHDAVNDEVAFPFGFGLAYTTFRIDEATVTAVADGGHSDEPRRGPVQAPPAATVTNTGDRAGAEVVQVDVGRPDATDTRPLRELRAFEKVHLEAGASQRVEMELTERDFSTWCSRTDRWRHEPGRATVWVGNSS